MDTFTNPQPATVKGPNNGKLASCAGKLILLTVSLNTIGDPNLSRAKS